MRAIFDHTALIRHNDPVHLRNGDHGFALHDTV